MSKHATIEEYVDAQAPALVDVARALVKTIDETDLLGSRAVWYGHPVWSVGPAPATGPVVYIKAYTKHVTLGFWSADTINDPNGTIKIGGSNMGSVKITTVEQAESLPIVDWISQTHRAVARSLD